MCLSLCGGLQCRAADAVNGLLADASEKIGARDFAGAETILTRLIQSQPDLAEAHNLMGVCEAQLGALDEAAASSGAQSS